MKEFDVLICGAGISGLYCAKKILEDAARLERDITVGIIESSDRIGGRIRTRRFPEFPGTPVELGPMRYLENHHLVSSLVAEYSLETHPFISGSDSMYFLRGESFTPDHDLSSQLKYALRKEEMGKTPSQLLEYAIDKVIPRKTWQHLRSNSSDCSNIQQLDWLEKIDINIGLKDFLLSILSEEAFCFIKDGSGYDSSFENWNAREAICHIIKDFLLQPDSFMITDGFEALSKALEADILSLGGKIYLNANLNTFDTKQSGCTTSVQCQIFYRDNKQYEVSAKKLILAVPQKSLLPIAKNSPDFSSPQVIELLHTVSPQPAVKVFFSYKEAWWKRLPERCETITTDIPLRKIYYQLHETEIEKQAGGVLLVTYADMEKFDFWNEFIDNDCNEETCAPPKMQQAITEMLSELHGIDVPSPVDSKVIRWSSDYAGAAYHAWNPGVNCTKIMQEIAKPVDDIPVFICGESYSKYQCWIEGALSSAEFILDNYFSDDYDEWIQNNDLIPLSGITREL